MNNDLKISYFDDDDTLVIRMSSKPIVREVSQDWRTHISYAKDGTAVELVILEAKGHQGAFAAAALAVV